MSRSESVTASTEGLLRIWPDFGQLLQVSRSTAYMLVATGEIPAVRIGSKITRVRPEDVEAFLEAHKAQQAAS